MRSSNPPRDVADRRAGFDGIDACARYALIVIAAATVYRLAFIGLFGPGPDEAFYWEWARRPALGYVEHPPLIAYTLWLITAIIGPYAWAWRLVAVFCTGASAWLLFCTGRRLFNSRVGFGAVLLHTASPVLGIACGAIIVPETLLIFWVCLGLYLSARLVVSHDPRWFYALGVVFGAALLSKLPGVLIPAALGLFALLSRRHRSWFLAWPPYAMVLIGLLMFTPVIYWNAQHDWAGLAFLGDRTEIKEESLRPGPGLLWQSLVSQAAYHSPVVFVLLWIGVLGAGWRGLRGRDDRALLLFCFSGPVMILFQFFAATHFTLPHWPLSGYIAAYVALPALFFSTPGPRPWARRFFRIGVVSGLALGMIGPVILFYPLTTLAYQKIRPYVGGPAQIIEPMAHAVGWSAEIHDGIAAAARRIEERTGQRPVVLTHFHMLAGMLAYALRDVCDPQAAGPCAAVMCVHAQAHQYAEWFDDDDLRDRAVLFVSSDAFPTSAGRAGQPEDYYQFELCEPLPPIPVVRRGVQINLMHLWSCSGYTGPAAQPGPRI